MRRNTILLALITTVVVAGQMIVALTGDRQDTGKSAAGTTPEVPTAMQADTKDVASNPIHPAPASEVIEKVGVASPTVSETFKLVDGRVDAHLRNTRLPAAVARIARAAGVDLAGREYLDDVPVRIDLDSVPAAEALIRLTAGYDSRFEYRGSRLTRMSIGPEAEARSDESQASVNELPPNFDQLDPQQRGDEIESIAGRGGDRARGAVVRALTDADEGVRFRALEQTQVVRGLALPVDALQTVLLQDSSETVRLKALDVLATDPEVDAHALASIADSARSDPSEQVRSMAQDIRQRLQSESRPQSP